MSVVTARAKVPGTLVTDYVLRMPKRPSGLILLLHGFQHSGQYIFEKLAPACPESAAILAPNGPYPLPDRRPDGSLRVGFSWYFYDPSRDDYFIDMEVGCELITGLVRQLSLEALPKRLVGFSQGGYLAPFAASRLSGVRQVVGLGAELLGEELRDSGAPWPPSFRMDQVHGEEDEIVRLESARRHHEWLKAEGVRSELLVLPGAGHRIGPDMVAGVRQALELESAKP